MRLIPALLTLALSASPAIALQAPQAGKDDARMQSAAYSPNQVYYLHLVVGHTLAITLPADQTNNEAFGSDAAHLRSFVPAGTNLVFLKPVAVMPAKSFFIHATTQGGHKLYTFQVDVVAADGDSQDPYTLRFTDPGAATAAQAAAVRAWRQQRDARATAAALRAAVASPVDTNPKYVLQGKAVADWNLLPGREVGDDGTSTHFHFAGGQRSPLIYAVSPDGKEATPDCSPDSETHITTCHQLAAQWRLRDGDAELCVFNKAFDAAGAPTPSGTSRPDVGRALRAQR